MTGKDYKATSIQVLKGLESVRKEYDLNWLASQIKNRGDIKNLAETLHIDESSLRRAVQESYILSLFPKLSRSKSGPLCTLKTKRELVKFLEKYDIYKLEVRQLYKIIKQYRNSIEENPNILLTQLEIDLIIGTTLGDGNIRQRNKNCSFRVGHSPKQEHYAKWKYEIMKEFIISEMSITQRILNGNLINTFEFSTFTHPIFNYYYKLFYKNGRKTVTRQVLDLLNPRSLAIWICDDGAFAKKQGYIILCTNSYSLDEHKLMKEYFEENWGISPTIGFRDSKYYYLRFKQNDTKKLISIIKPFIPKGMEYKIGE